MCPLGGAGQCTFWRLGEGYVLTLVAVLGVCEELARTVNVHARSLYRVLEGLAGIGIFSTGFSLVEGMLGDPY